jgi:hypothetical protein
MLLPSVCCLAVWCHLALQRGQSIASSCFFYLIISASHAVPLLHCLQVIGHAAAERLLLSGSMVPPQRALQLGLVDELVADKAQLLTRAEVRLEQLTLVDD